jgi:hypothetical protein
MTVAISMIAACVYAGDDNSDKLSTNQSYTFSPGYINATMQKTHDIIRRLDSIKSNSEIMVENAENKLAGDIVEDAGTKATVELKKKTGGSSIKTSTTSAGVTVSSGPVDVGKAGAVLNQEIEKSENKQATVTLENGNVVKAWMEDGRTFFGITDTNGKVIVQRQQFRTDAQQDDATNGRMSLLDMQYMGNGTYGVTLRNEIDNEKYIAVYNKAFERAYNQTYDSAYKEAYDIKFGEAYYNAYSSMYDSFYSEAYASNYNSIYAGLYSSLYNGIYNSKRDELYTSIYDAQFSAAFWEHYNAVYQQQYDQMYSQLYKQAYNDLYSQIYTQAYNDYYNQVGYDSEYFWSAYSTLYASIYDRLYAQNYGSAYTSAYNTMYQKRYDELYNQAYDSTYSDTYWQLRNTYSWDANVFWSYYRSKVNEVWYSLSVGHYNEIYSDIYNKSYSAIYDQQYKSAYDGIYAQTYQSIYQSNYDQIYSQAYDQALGDHGVNEYGESYSEFDPVQAQEYAYQVAGAAAPGLESAAKEQAAIAAADTAKQSAKAYADQYVLDAAHGEYDTYIANLSPWATYNKTCALAETYMQGVLRDRAAKDAADVAKQKAADYAAKATADAIESVAKGAIESEASAKATQYAMEKASAEAATVAASEAEQQAAASADQEAKDFASSQDYFFITEQAESFAAEQAASIAADQADKLASEEAAVAATYEAVAAANEQAAEAAYLSASEEADSIAKNEAAGIATDEANRYADEYAVSYADTSASEEASIYGDRTIVSIESGYFESKVDLSDTSRDYTAMQGSDFLSNIDSMIDEFTSPVNITGLSGQPAPLKSKELSPLALRDDIAYSAADGIATNAGVVGDGGVYQVLMQYSALAAGGLLTANDGKMDVALLMADILKNPTVDQKNMIDLCESLIKEIDKVDESGKSSDIKNAQDALLQAVANILIAQAIPDLLKEGDMAAIRDIFRNLDTEKVKLLADYNGAVDPYYTEAKKLLSSNMDFLQMNNIVSRSMLKEELDKLRSSDIDKIMKKVKELQNRSVETEYIIQKDGELRSIYIDPNKKIFDDRMKQMLEGFTQRLSKILEATKK